VRAIIAKSYARIHESNLVNFGIPPLRFADPGDYARVGQGDVLEISDLRTALADGRPIRVRDVTNGSEFDATHALSPRQLYMLLAGGLSAWLQAKWAREAAEGVEATAGAPRG
jgi:aconitate hydratase